jgi:hypothetical protein
MQSTSIRKLFMLVTLLASNSSGLATAAMASTHAPSSPLARQHCKNVGPIALGDDDFCGCTWGAVYVNGTPVVGAQVTLTFGTGVTNALTLNETDEPFPYYSTHADDLGAKYGDVATLSANYNGQTLTRTIRFTPNTDDEQNLNFVFPAWGHWQKYQTAPQVRAVAFYTATNTLWVGTTGGVVSWNVGTGVSTTHSTGQTSPAVQALAVAPNGDVWVGTASGLSRFDGTNWAPQNTGLASNNIRAIAFGQAGTVWAASNDAVNGGISKLNGTSWTPQPDVNGASPNRFTALQVDASGHLWVGTDGNGVLRWDGAAAQAFTTAQGLASDIISDIAFEPSAGVLWFATRSYSNANGAFGGVARYVLSSGQWTVFTRTAGLVADDVLAVALDAQGRKWFGTSGGVAVFDSLNWWRYTTTTGSALGGDVVRTLAGGAGSEMWAGAGDEVSRFVSAVPGAPPIVNALTVSPTVGTPLPNRQIAFQASAVDGDSAGSQVVGYEWRSDLEGALGTEISFTLRLLRLRVGTHAISLRVQDDEGTWSQPLTTTLTVVPPQRVFLPVATK